MKEEMLKKATGTDTGTVKSKSKKSQSADGGLQMYNPKKDKKNKKEKPEKKLVMMDSPHNGLVNQFLEMKNAFLLSRQANRELNILAVGMGKSSCQLFDLPLGSGIKCTKKKAPKCKDEKKAEVLVSLKKNVLYCGPLKLKRSDPQAIIEVIDAIQFPLAFNAEIVESIELFKSFLGIKKPKRKKGQISPKAILNVVNWECNRTLTTSVIKDLKDLIDDEKKKQREEMVGTESETGTGTNVEQRKEVTYISLPCPIDEASNIILKNNGMTIFDDVWPKAYTIPTDENTRTALELGVMLEANVYLGYGESALNDLVEFERFNRNSSFCTVPSSTPTPASSDALSHTWCSLHDKQEKDRNSVFSKVTSLLRKAPQTLPLSPQLQDGEISPSMKTELMLGGMVITMTIAFCLYKLRQYLFIWFLKKHERDTL